MKKIIVLLLAAVIFYGCQKEIETTYNGDVILTTQSELDEFGKNNYETINGNLQIGIVGAELEATDILYDKALASLKRVEGDLVISNTSLHWIEGLKNLDYIGGDFYFSRNHRIVKLQGLTNISYLGGSLIIIYNKRLETIDSFNNINLINGDINIFGGVILSIDFLNNVKSIEGNLLCGRIHISDLNGLNKLENIGGWIRIEENGSLINLDDLSNLSTVYGWISIIGNKALDDLCGLSNVLERFDGDFFCHKNKYNPSKEDILAGNCSLD